MSENFDKIYRELKDIPYITVHKKKHGASIRIRIWDGITSKVVSKTVPVPPDIPLKKLSQWANKEVEKLQSHINYRTSVTSPSATFDEFFHGEWFTEASKTNSEPDMYEYQMAYGRHLKDTLGPVPLNKIVPRTLEDAYDAIRAKGRSDDFVHRMHKMVSMVLEEAKRKGIIDVNVARERMRAPRRSQKTRLETDQKALSPDEVVQIIHCLDNEPLYWRCLFYTLIITGIRRGEVDAITWDCIDFEKKRILIDKAVRRMPHDDLIIKDPKTYSSKRYVPMTPDLMELFRQLQESRGGNDVGFVFKGLKDPNKPLHPDSITYHTSLFCKKNNLPKFTPQTLRSTFVSTLIAMLGIDPTTAKDLVGHSSIDVTMGIYSHSKEQARRNAQSALQNMINNRLESMDWEPHTTAECQQA